MVADGENATGVKLFQTGQHEAAMHHFQKALAQDPTSADAYYNLGATVHQAGKQGNDSEQFERAEALYNQCLDHHSDHSECYRGLAVLLVETGRSDRAFTLLKNWVIRRPESSNARIELARLYDEFGDKDSARRQLEYALLITPRNERLLTAMGHIRESSGDYDQAIMNYQRALAINPHQSQLIQHVASLRGRINTSSPLGQGGTRMVQESWSPRY